MIKNLAFCVGIVLSALTNPGHASQCPTPIVMAGILRCIDAAGGSVDAAERCAGGWDWDQLWQCLKTNPAYDGIPWSARIAPPQASPPAQDSALTCGPQLTAGIAQKIEQGNPGADPTVKEMALEKALQLYGCLPPPLPTPPPQITTCLPLGGGAYRCTTQ